MKKHIKLIIFGIFCIIQIVILSHLTYKGRVVGKVVKMPIMLRDPYDPLKGRYLALSIGNRTHYFKEYRELEGYIKDGDTIYCRFNRSGDLLYISEYFTQSTFNEITIKAKVSYVNESAGYFYIDYDFDRYYIQENYAIRAEQIIREDSKPILHLSVDDDGNARIKKLTVYNNIQIEEYIKKHDKK